MKERKKNSIAYNFIKYLTLLKKEEKENAKQCKETIKMLLKNNKPDINNSNDDDDNEFFNIIDSINKEKNLEEIPEKLIELKNYIMNEFKKEMRIKYFLKLLII